MTNLDIFSEETQAFVAREIVDDKKASINANRFKQYAFKPNEYVEQFLGWKAWKAVRPEKGEFGQYEILELYALTMRKLIERDAFDRGVLTEDKLKVYKPGEVIKNWISIDAGHNVGKTKLQAAIVSHFFDCFAPSIVYAFAPTDSQINDLLFKEIRVDRQGKNLPGVVLDGEPRIKYRSNHFVKGRATSDAGGRGTERAQGQHNKFLLVIVDEAEGAPDFIWDAIKSMTSGGIAIVVYTRNPRTDNSHAHVMRSDEWVFPVTISCLNHPNVVHNMSIIPSSVTRDYIYKMLDTCTRVDEHSEKDYTFELDWQPGIIYKPSTEWFWRVLGIVPGGEAFDTFVTRATILEASERVGIIDYTQMAQIGIDIARYGGDAGTIYLTLGNVTYRVAKIYDFNTIDYFNAVIELLQNLYLKGTRRVSIRVDGTGGWGNGLIDLLKYWSESYKFAYYTVYEVQFNTTAPLVDMFKDIITQLYWYAGQKLKHSVILDIPPELIDDLSRRPYQYVSSTREVKGIKKIVELRQLLSKKMFKTKHHRSPDDGDGFVLSIGDEAFFRTNAIVWETDEPYEQSNDSIRQIQSFVSEVYPMKASLVDTIDFFKRYPDGTHFE